MKVLLFGTFDGVHDGHRHFLRESKALGDSLVAVVAPDSAVQTFKNRLPKRTLKERIRELEAENLADMVIAGDETQGGWEVIRKQRPDIVAIGWDQHNLKKALEKSLTQFPFTISLHTITFHDKKQGK